MKSTEIDKFANFFFNFLEWILFCQIKEKYSQISIAF